MKQKTTHLQILDPKTIIATMEAKQPAWVKELHSKEDMANSVLATSQEMLLVVMDTLRRYHNFTEEDLKLFTREVEDVLRGVKEFEEHGLNILTPNSVDVVAGKVEQIGIGGLLQEIANTRLTKEKMVRAGLEYPVSLAATPFLKQVQEKNK